MSIPFHICITRQNWSKNEQATPKGLRITLLGLHAKGKKILKSEANILRFFDIFIREKMNYSNRTTRNMGLGDTFRVDTYIVIL